MNIKLILGLSLFGVVMGFAGVYLPSKAEPFCWLPVYVCCAWLIAKYAGRKFFLHGVLTNIAAAVWVTVIHIAMSDTYMSHHAKEAAQYAKLQKDINLSPATTMIIMTPIIGIVFGLMLGVFSNIAVGLRDR